MILAQFFLCGLAALIGAATGSFLNVVIHRMPQLIDAGEDRHVVTLLRRLSWPPSHCPHCQKRLLVRDNVPILSFFLLNGRCRFCDAPISPRYVLVEIMCAVLFAYAVASFGWTAQAFLSAAFAAGLLALSCIDIEEQLLPDAVLLPLFVSGLLFHGVYGAGLPDAALGAGTGYAALWCIRTAYHLYAGEEGLGEGDLKLAAVIGAWLGLTAIPAVLFIAFSGGVMFFSLLMLFKRVDSSAPVPFGPFLALGALSVLAMPALPASMMAMMTP